MQTTNNQFALEHATSIGPRWLVVIAAGSGGPQALAQMLPRFPTNFPGTIIVFQHMRPGFTRVLADQLSHTCQLPVHEAGDGDALQAGRILLVPAATSLSIEMVDPVSRCPHVVVLESIAKSSQNTGRADRAMACAARMFGANTTGVLLTGMGNDGCEGLRAISKAGGVALVQDEQTCVVHDLPASAIEAGVDAEVLPLWSIPDRIMEIVMGDTNVAAA